MLLRSEGPCYICGRPTPYRSCKFLERCGPDWIDRQFLANRRERLLSEIRSGLLGEKGEALMGFICDLCKIDLRDVYWPAAELERKKKDIENRREMDEKESLRAEAERQRANALRLLTRSEERRVGK